MKNSLGICVGASTIKIVKLKWENDEPNIVEIKTKNHEGNPKQAFLDQIKNFKERTYDYITVTGRKFKDAINLPSITEPEATEYALTNFLKKDNKSYNALISLGSENFILYGLNKEGNIIKVQTGNKCASGTGEFFLQQIGRMNVDVEKAINLAKDSEPYYVSGRCSVFCKSDCTHALNKGIPIGRVCAGLGDMIAEKIIELLRTIEPKDILVVGGVTKNDYVINRLKQKINNLAIPENADIFEALGAALYAYKNKKTGERPEIIEGHTTFSTLPPLSEAEKLVSFKTQERGNPKEGDECILGLDVGSTTTKAALLRTKDNKVLADIYLRTEGDPIKASRNCYKEILNQLKEIKVKIIGLGVTGSGRYIAGLHAETDGIINEIIAHATGALFFDKDVDTIFEIGGQDAKYTFLINSVPCDYAMNEACSAGTGSFLEEAAKESLNINYLQIQDIALKADNPPNFNDQCAAFISSDIKNASHENISQENIVAGLVYSICMNYNNRVKGERKVGNKIFMQGGVCYNKAVPLAMASLLKKEIIVPPDPGLIGAFGLALEIKNRINNGLLKKQEFKLEELKDRQVEYGKSFICQGQPENCDRACSINMIKLNNKQFPFGGACNKYYNMIHHINIDSKDLDLVKKRQDMVYEDYEKNEKDLETIGISRSFYSNSYFPLFYNFFNNLGFNVVLSDEVDSLGVKKVNSSFCYPVEISHGLFQNLLNKKTDYIFLPHVNELFIENPNEGDNELNCTCIIAQSEPYYIRSAFDLGKTKLITPIINFSKGLQNSEKIFTEMASHIGKDKEKAIQAYNQAIEKQVEFFKKRKEIGKEILRELEKDPSKTAIVLFGRPYNAFAEEANLGIPKKFTSRGYYIIPFDFLPYKDMGFFPQMCWAMGLEIIRAARFIKEHPQLYGAFITNFSCGPDSFLVGYFRDIMGDKPSLTLELDSHSADAGVTTRVEAFLDIVERYRKLNLPEKTKKSFQKAKIIEKDGKFMYQSSENRLHELTDKNVKLYIPSMGRTGSEMVSASFRGFGFNSVSVKLPDFSTLMLGRANSSCKECLPLILTTGSLMESINNKKEDELLLYFMPTGTGNCRFAQYSVFMNNLIEKRQIPNAALMTLSSANSYAGLGSNKALKLLKGFIVSDAMDDIKNNLAVLAENKQEAMDIFDDQWKKIIKSFENNSKDLYNILEVVAYQLSKIKLKTPLKDAKKVLLAGEIYVRRDEFATQGIIERLAKRNIIGIRAPIMEWMYYVDYLVENILDHKFTFKERSEMVLRKLFQVKYEKKIKNILAKSNVYEPEMLDVEDVMKHGEVFISPYVTGETIVTIGGFFKEIVKHYHGFISVGPFACMPTRIVESILSVESKIAENQRIDNLEEPEHLKKFHTLPFLSIECDGNPFPQIIESQIEAFALQVERLYNTLNKEQFQVH